MVIMKVCRNKRNTLEDLEWIIGCMCNNTGKVVYMDAAGVVLGSTGFIVNSFLIAQNAYADNLNVKIHVLELIFTKDQFELERVINVVRRVLYYFYSAYQCFVIVEEREDGYHAMFGINACSYNGAGKFVDNNYAYIGLREVLKELIGEEVSFFYDPTVLFTDQINKVGNYISVTDTK
jgi:hypothetical protein